MPIYQFKGKRYANGLPIVGEKFAQNKQALAILLRNEQILPISIKEKGKELSLPKFRSKVKDKELAVFTKQFSVMIDAGLPLVQCLDIMATQHENRTFQDVLFQVRNDVEGGSTLADAMKRHPKVFDNLFTNMIAAGEAGGILDTILQRLTVFIEKMVKLKRAVRSASIYPSVIVAVAVGVVTIIMLKVIPIFATLFEGLGADLPLPTLIVMRISHLLGQFFIFILAAIILAVFGIRYYYKTEGGRLVIDKLLLTVPIFGVVLKKIAVARFSRTLSTLLVSGIPILEGLDITARTAGNKIIENALLRTRKTVEEGKTIVEPLKQSALFPPMVVQMIGVGEQTGELDQMLTKIADYYDEEADVAIANFLTLLEPLLIVFLGVVVGGIVVSMYLPLFTMIAKLSSAH
ncbi:MAG TPA: type II secretion system F family protein [Acidobacteriota bacterium]|jgi:type IV pilus assembly protein PilC|nr:type II secretion system F family protein [Acidobacteriota bacterium]